MSIDDWLWLGLGVEALVSDSPSLNKSLNTARWDQKHAGKLAFAGVVVTAIGAALSSSFRRKQQLEGKEENKNNVFPWIISVAGLSATVWGVYNMLTHDLGPGITK